MSITSRSMLSRPGSEIGQGWHLRWTGAVSAWTDPFGVCAGAGRRQLAVALVVAWEALAPDEIVIESWLEHPGFRRDVLPRTVVPATTSVDDDLLHVDAALGDERLLTVTIDPAASRLLYGTTSILSRSEFTVGSFDPPTVERAARVPNVASA